MLRLRLALCATRSDSHHVILRDRSTSCTNLTSCAHDRSAELSTRERPRKIRTVTLLQRQFLSTHWNRYSLHRCSARRYSLFRKSLSISSLRPRSPLRPVNLDNIDWVLDTAGVLPDTAVSDCNRLIRRHAGFRRTTFVHAFSDLKSLDTIRIYETTKAQVALVTLTELPEGYTSAKKCATDLFNQWQLGSEDRNDGVLILLITGERAIEIEVGIGLEALLTTARLGDMLDQQVVPELKYNNFHSAFLSALLDLERMLAGTSVIERNHQSERASTRRSDSDGDGSSAWILLIALAMIIIIQFARLNEECGNCKAKGTIVRDYVPLDTSDMIPPASSCDNYYYYYRSYCKQCGHTKIRRERIRPNRSLIGSSNGGGSSSGSGGAGSSYY